MSLTDLLNIAAGVALIEGAVYAAKGIVYYLKYHNNPTEKPTRMEKLFVMMPSPLDFLYFLAP